MNYIPQVVKMLGVEIGEEFIIKTLSGEKVYFFKENGLYERENNRWQDLKLAEILNGDYEITKMTWRPKVEEKYFIPDIRDGLPYSTGFVYGHDCNSAWFPVKRKDNHNSRYIA